MDLDIRQRKQSQEKKDQDNNQSMEKEDIPFYKMFLCTCPCLHSFNMRKLYGMKKKKKEAENNSNVFSRGSDTVVVSGMDDHQEDGDMQSVEIQSGDVQSIDQKVIEKIDIEPGESDDIQTTILKKIVDDEGKMDDRVIVQIDDDNSELERRMSVSYNQISSCLLSNLRTISELKVGDKLRVSNDGWLSIDQSSFQVLTRTLTGNNKVNTIYRVKKTLIIGKQRINDPEISVFYTDGSLLQGVENLIQTYRGYPVADELEALVAEIF